MSKYAKLSAGLLAAWLVFSLLSSALHLYRNAPNTPPLALGLAVVTPMVLFLVWFASSQGFRQFVLSLSRAPSHWCKACDRGLCVPRPRHV